MMSVGKRRPLKSDMAEFPLDACTMRGEEFYLLAQLAAGPSHQAHSLVTSS